MDEVHDLDLAGQLSDLRRQVTAQSSRIAELEERVGPYFPSQERSTRRGMLRLAGAAVVGGAAASLIGAQPAAATIGAMNFGQGNDAGADQTTLTSSIGGTTMTVHNTSPSGEGLRGTASGDGTGVSGLINSPGASAYGVWGSINGASGFALVGAGGAAQLYLTPQLGSLAPASGVHLVGEVVANSGGFFGCVSGGTPGSWRKLAGPATAGAFHAITPTRVYDSRAPLPNPGILATGATRGVSVADGRDSAGAVVTPDLVPVGATAVAANVTVTGTTGGFGYLAINPGGNFVEGASTINWFGAGQTLANGVGLTLNSHRILTVICNGGGSTHFIIDIAGYYL